MKANSIFASNFVGLKSVDVPLSKPVVLFAGRNGAGKTSIAQAIRLALLGDIPRVSLKSQKGMVIHDGAKAATIRVDLTDARLGSIAASAHMTPTTIKLPEAARHVSPVMNVCLGSMLIGELKPSELQVLLSDVLRVPTDAATIAATLIERGHTAARVSHVKPLLRAGFDAAANAANTKASEARGAWRALTGEEYGSIKAKTWAPVPAEYDAAEHEELTAAVASIDASIASGNQTIGMLRAQAAAKDVADRQAAALKADADALQGRTATLAKLRKTSDDVERELAMAIEAHGTPSDRPNGDMHDMALLLSCAAEEMDPMGTPELLMQIDEALSGYEMTHGAITPEQRAARLSATQPDPEARQRIADMRSRLSDLAAAIEEAELAVKSSTEARDALAQRSNERPEGTQSAADAMESAQRIVAELQEERAKLATKADAMAAAATASKAAGQIAQRAKSFAEDAEAWTALRDALLPTGLPAELTAKTVDPFNAALEQISLDVGWPLMKVNADLSLTYGGRPYCLISESHQWRFNAMAAAAVANLSGTKLLLLDRMDVLETPDRMNCLGWLSCMADADELDTAIVFATLDALPREADDGMPANAEAFWVEDGRCVAEAEEAAEAAAA